MLPFCRSKKINRNKVSLTLKGKYRHVMVDVSAALTHGRLDGAAVFMFHLSRRAVNVCERRVRSWKLAASEGL